MRKKLLSLILLFLFGIVTIHAQHYRYDFSAVCPSGDTLYYKINSDSLTVTIISPSHYAGDYNNWDMRTMPSGIVTIPSIVSNSGNTYSVTAIGDGAFSCCSGIETITIPNSVVSIERVAFLNCHSLSSVVLPNNLSVISQGTFSGCYNLGEVTIGSSVTEIDEEAFSMCTSLTPVIVPSTVSSIGLNAFYRVKMVQYTGDAVGAPWGAFCINGYEEDSLYYTSNVKDTLIGAHPSIVTANIPISVRVIGANTFGGFRTGYNSFTKGCEHLISVTIPSSVNSIGSEAFSGCKKLTSVTLPHSVTSIGGAAFSRCINLDTIFYNAGRLTYFSYPAITDVYAYDWIVDSSSRNALKYLYIGDSVTSLGQQAFSGCTRLKSVTIGKSINAIATDAFERCDSITTLFYNAENCTGHNVFNQMNQLNTLHLGNNVRVIPSNMFRGLTSIQTIYLDADSNQITFIGANAFSGCINMAGHIVVPHVTELGDGAFSGCGLLSSVELGNGLSAIGDTVFKGCEHLTNVTIGRGVQRIADNAFEDCTEIRLLTSRALNPPTIYRTTFEDVDDDISLRVPCEAVAAYQNAPFWSHFTNIEGKFDFFFSATSADITMGSVTIVHAPVCDNIEAHIQANPYHGYRFSHWSDGDTTNPRYMVVTQDTIITAIFESTEGIEIPDQQIGTVHPTKGNRIVVRGAAGERIRVFDMMGRMVATKNNATEIEHFRMSAAGVYLVQVSDGAAQRVVIP